MKLNEQESPIVAKPYLVLLLVELALIVFIAGGSAVVSIAGWSHPAAPFLGFIPLALFLLLFLSRNNRAHTYYLSGASKLTARQWLDYAPLLAVLIVLLVANQGFASAPVSTFVYLLLTQLLLVGFVEEMLFRGILLRVFAHKGMMFAVLISSFFFGVTHVLQALGGQSLEETLLQIGYAFAIGLVLALLVVKNRSVILTIIFHGLHNFINMTGHERGASFYDYAVILLLIIYALWLVRSLHSGLSVKQGVAPNVT